MGHRLGVDVGGTFTDLVMLDEQSGKKYIGKVPSTPAAPDRAVILGIRQILEETGVKPAEISFLIHGTTVATNALIERKGVRVALVVTRGFRDVLHIGRQTRPKLYDFTARRPDPLVPRHLRFEVPERILAGGRVLEALDEDAVRALAREIARQGIQVVVVCLINAYANDAHERRIKQILAEELPGVRVSLSTEVLPEFKEYERMSTTVINAYVMPIIERYLKRIMDDLQAMGVGSDLHIMQSNGGVMTSETASKMSVHTILSGPAAGVIGAVMLGRMIGEENLITIDMGGTSFDVSLVYRGEMTFTTESEIDGNITKVPMIDIKTLGAGGGSIAWIDTGGALQVGPRSAGADPGPACYGRGGTEPAVTDANLLLGYLNPTYIAGGSMHLDREKARQAVEEKIARPLGLTVEQAALGIVRVVNATMVKGIRIVSVEKGYDPRQFTLVAFGGAGPVHAAMLAQELDIPRIIVPINPGLTCALGVLMADFRHDYVQTYLEPISSLDLDTLNRAYEELETKAIQQMVSENVPEGSIMLRRKADMRYLGQGYTLEVDIASGRLSDAHLAEVTQAFHQVHESNYGYRMQAHDVEFVNLRIIAIGMLAKPHFEKEALVHASPGAALKEIRRVYIDGQYAEVPIYERNRLEPGQTIAGPCIIEQFDSTSVVLPRYQVQVDPYRNLIITRLEDGNGHAR